MADALPLRATTGVWGGMPVAISPTRRRPPLRRRARQIRQVRERHAAAHREHAVQALGEDQLDPVVVQLDSRLGQDDQVGVATQFRRPGKPCPRNAARRSSIVAISRQSSARRKMITWCRFAQSSNCRPGPRPALPWSGLPACSGRATALRPARRRTRGPHGQHRRHFDPFDQGIVVGVELLLELASVSPWAGTVPTAGSCTVPSGVTLPGRTAGRGPSGRRSRSAGRRAGCSS